MQIGQVFRQFQYPTSPLAPVADLQLRSLLATTPVVRQGEQTEQEMDDVFARLAREAEGIQDIDAKMRVPSRAAA
ncbi:hypothetical protein [Streptomyces sp. NPDC056304]|uniref:hypothetical protein n=1 Tax=Streptomyces sp. NPDC056304 TaxID=3345778 RepID=UPI0035E2AFF3